MEEISALLTFIAVYSQEPRHGNTKCTVDEWLKKIHSYDGTLFSHKTKLTICDTKLIDLEGSKLSEVSQKGKKNTV